MSESKKSRNFFGKCSVRTPKAIAAKIAAPEADYVLALKSNQATPRGDLKPFFDERELSANCAIHKTTGIGHGRKPRPERQKRQNPRGIAAITSTPITKKTGQASIETRFDVTSLPADPFAIRAATRALWRIENNLRWRLDIAFDEDRGRSNTDISSLNLAVVRHAVQTSASATARRPPAIPHSEPDCSHLRA